MISLLEKPIVSYAIMLLLSLLAAVLCFQVGGSVASIAGESETFFGLGIQAGGAIGGFIIILILSLRVVQKLQESTPMEERLLRQYVLRTPDQGFDPTDQDLSCRYSLYDQENGGWGEWKRIGFVREVGGLRIQVPEMKPNHIIRVRLADSRANQWVCDEDCAYGVSPIFLRRA